MAKLFKQIGGLVLFNKRHNRVRASIIFLLTNFLLFAGIVFTVEIILILLGMGNVFVPITHRVGDVLIKLVL
jgi:hypothetical protein